MFRWQFMVKFKNNVDRNPGRYFNKIRIFIFSQKRYNLYLMYYLLRPADIVADTSVGTLLQI